MHNEERALAFKLKWSQANRHTRVLYYIIIIIWFEKGLSPSTPIQKQSLTNGPELIMYLFKWTNCKF